MKLYSLNLLLYLSRILFVLFLLKNKQIDVFLAWDESNVTSQNILFEP